jgi:uncharacterized protein (DUF488 family)
MTVASSDDDRPPGETPNGAESAVRAMNDPPPANRGLETTVFAFGYQGRDLDQLLRAVRASRIELVVDVRERATSRKPGFAAQALKESLSAIGVAYVHLPELGCPSESRHALWRQGDVDPFFESYRRRLAEHPGALPGLLLRLRSARSLLLCLERDPSRCHRAVLVERLRVEGFAAEEL